MVRSYTKVAQTKSEKTIQAHINPPLALLTQDQLLDTLGSAIEAWSTDKDGMILDGLSVSIRKNEVLLRLVKPKQEDTP